MKSELFKKLIKQCVKEAMREELPLVLLEYQQRSTPVITENIKPLFQNQNNNEEIKEIRNNMKNKMSDLFGLQKQHNEQPIETLEENKNPYLSFIVDAAQNLTPQERSGLSHYD